MFPENGVHLLVQPKDLEKEEFIICSKNIGDFSQSDVSLNSKIGKALS